MVAYPIVEKQSVTVSLLSDILEELWLNDTLILFLNPHESGLEFTTLVGSDSHRCVST